MTRRAEAVNAEAEHRLDGGAGDGIGGGLVDVAKS
jgi:hypothetical protein